MPRLKLSRPGKFRIGEPYRYAFFWIVPYVRRDPKGNKIDGVYRYDVRRKGFIDLVEEKHVLMRVLARLRAAMRNVGEELNL